MDTRRWESQCLKYTIVKPEDIEMCKKRKVVRVESNSLDKGSKHDQVLKKATQDLAPERWGEETKMPK